VVAGWKLSEVDVWEVVELEKKFELKYVMVDGLGENCITIVEGFTWIGFSH